MDQVGQAQLPRTRFRQARELRVRPEKPPERAGPILDERQALADFVLPGKLRHAIDDALSECAMDLIGVSELLISCERTRTMRCQAACSSSRSAWLRSASTTS